MNKIFFPLVFVVFFSLGAQASWVSSGGELFQDAHNPWFVRNTEKISYCVEIDQQTISAKKETIESLIEKAFSYWKTEFSRAKQLDQAGSFTLGQQIVIKTDCDQETDIRFLFGYGTLSPKMIKYLVKPEKFIGVTVRTNYDKQQLKGKGFVYISSDLGANSYHNPGNLIEQAWKRDRLLEYVLIHEVGHIFGIPHEGSGVMSEVFLDQMLNKSLVHIFEKIPIENYMHIDKKVVSCSEVFSGNKLNWFDIKKDFTCVGINIDPNKKSWSVFAKKNRDSEEEVSIGQIRSQRIQLGDLKSRPISVLNITDEQKVFSPKETAFRSFMFGPNVTSYSMKAVYFSNDRSEPKPVYIKFDPTSLSVIALNKERRTSVEPVFVYNSPLSLFMLLPPKF